MVQWLRLCTSMARDTGLVPGQGIKILHAEWHGQKGGKKKNDVTLLNYFEDYMRKQMQWAWLLMCGLFLINTEW